MLGYIGIIFIIGYRDTLDLCDGERNKILLDLLKCVVGSLLVDLLLGRSELRIDIAARARRTGKTCVIVKEIIVVFNAVIIVDLDVLLGIRAESAACNNILPEKILSDIESGSSLVLVNRLIVCLFGNKSIGKLGNDRLGSAADGNRIGRSLAGVVGIGIVIRKSYIDGILIAAQSCLSSFP